MNLIANKVGEVQLRTYVIMLTSKGNAVADSGCGKGGCAC